MFDDDDWVALVIEWIDGRMPTAPLDTLDRERLLHLVEQLALIEADDHLEPCYDAHPGVWGHWQRLRDEPQVGLDPWSLRHLEALADLEADVAEAIRGDRLVHLDLRSDNVIFADAGLPHDVVVDWPGASAGAPWIDLAGLLPSLELDGGPSPHDAFEQHPLGRAADPEAASIFVAALAGYFTRMSLLRRRPGCQRCVDFRQPKGRSPAAGSRNARGGISTSRCDPSNQSRTGPAIRPTLPRLSRGQRAFWGT